MKTFLEVFPDLHIAENVRGLLEMVGIEKISTKRDPRLHRQPAPDAQAEYLRSGKRHQGAVISGQTGDDQDFGEIPSVQPVHAGKTHECVPGQYFDGAEKLQYPSL